MSARPRRRLFWRTAAVVVGVLILAIALPAVVTIRSTGALFLEQLRERAATTVKTFSLEASDLVAAGDSEALSRLVVTLAHEDPAVQSALVTDRHGRVLAHSDPRQEGMVLPDLVSPPEEVTFSGVSVSGESNGLRVTGPIRVSGEAWGAFRIEVPLSVIEKEEWNEILRVVILGSIVLILGAGGAAWLARSIANPVERLAAMTQVVARGRFDVRSGVRTGDEIGTLAEAFDGMAAQLARDQEELRDYSRSLEQRVEERTAQLSESEARTRAIVESALDAIITIDGAGRIVGFNRAGEVLFGHRREDILGRDMADLFIPPALRERHRAGLARVAAGGESQLIGRRVELSALRADGTEIPVEIAITRLPHAGDPSFTGHVRDLTERRQAEKALREREEQLRQSQKMEAIGTLAGGVAHDFNNLLTGILGYAEILKHQTQAGDKVLQAATIIETAARRAATLTQQLLGFARKGKHQNVAVDLHATITEVISLLDRTINKSINLRRDLRAPAAFVLGDPGQMHQVILNLAVNAVDAMPQGGDLVFSTDLVRPRRHQSSVPADAPADPQLMVTVTDTGVGIPEEGRDRLFEPFFTTKQKGKGTGMGLAMVYGIVKNHGGTIRVESEPGRGTTFRIYLPPAPASAAPEDVARRAEMVIGSGRILVVDDEEVVRSVAAEFLNVLGYEVVTAADGREALQIYRNRGRDLDLVILDMIMPRMGGPECFRALKEIDPGVRVVLSTGHSFNIAAQELLDEGMLGFLQKPYQMEQMSSVVAGALRGRG